MAESGGRIGALDRLRGLVMALMALDHTRVFFLGFAPDPTDLEATTPALFLTRWITHLCAPAFLLLAGIGAGLRARTRPRAEVAGWLLSRGALLMVLEATLITFAWIPDPTRSLGLLQVIWAIGASMILLSALLWLPRAAVGALGAALIALQPLIGAKAFAALGLPESLHALLLAAEARVEAAGTVWIVSYPILPWAGVMALGWAFAPLFAAPGWPRRAAALGAGLLLAFAALRAGTWGGDPRPWAMQADALGTLMSFVNADKYPPSPVFLLMTLGAALPLAAALTRLPGRPGRWLEAIGRAPLFFYILHLYALRAAGLAAAAWVWGPGALGPPPAPSTPQWPLWAVWLVWAAAMAALYVPTRRFARFKARRGGWASWL